MFYHYFIYYYVYEFNFILNYFSCSLFSYVWTCHLFQNYLKLYPQTASAQIFGAVAEACSAQLIYHFNFLVPEFASELQSVHELILHCQSDDANNVIQVKDDEVEDDDDEVDGEDEEEEEDFEDIADDESLEQLTERFSAIKAAASAVFATVDSQGVGFL